MSDTSETAPRVLHQTLVGAGTMLLGVFYAWGATGIPGEAGYAGVGPNFLPWLVSVGLLVCGGMLVWQARTGGWRNDEEPSGAPRGDWDAMAWISAGVLINAGQTISREQVLRLYTADNAWFLGPKWEQKVGTIERGKWADLVVLSADYFDPHRVSDEQIMDIRSVMTIVNGKVVHDELGQ
mgnify:CR=1 FL=1